MANLVQNIDSFACDNLFAGHEIPVLTKGVTLEAGQGELVRGTVLGKVTKAVGTVTGPDAANGTISAVTLGKSAKIGTYSLVCTTATDTGVAAVFKVVDPDGMILNDAVAGTAYAGPINFTITEGTGFDVGTKAVGEIVGPDTAKGTISTVVLGKTAKLGTYTLTCTTATDTGIAAVFKAVDPDGMRLDDATAGIPYVGPINFTITEGTGFDVGDKFSIPVVAGSGQYKDEFSIPVVAGSGQYKIVNSTNVDGSQDADCILADNADTSSSGVTAVAYKTGYFNRNALVFGGTDTADIHEHTLRTLGIFLSENVKPVEA